MQKSSRLHKHKRVRKSVMGTLKSPRLAVYRSNQHIYAQIIDDQKSVTLVAYSDMTEKGTKKEKAFLVGKKLAEKALKSKISSVVFDRGGFLYHGRIAELARGAREGGLKF